jgi:hypothetical protein
MDELLFFSKGEGLNGLAATAANGGSTKTTAIEARRFVHMTNSSQ